SSEWDDDSTQNIPPYRLLTCQFPTHHWRCDSGRTWKADGQVAQDPHREESKTFSLDGIAPPAKLLNRNEFHFCSFNQHSHHRWVAATTATHRQSFRSKRQNIQSLANRRGRERGQCRGPIF